MASLNTRDIAAIVFRDLLKAPGDPLDWKRISRWLTPHEFVGLWCYVRIAAETCPALLDQARAAERAAALPADYLAATTARLIEIARRLPEANRTARRIFESPDAELIRDIGQAVIRFAREHKSRRRELRGLESPVFQQASDRLLLSMLESLPVVGKLMGKIVDVAARQNELHLLANATLVTRDSMPRVWACYDETCQILGLRERPPLFVDQQGANAYTMGADRAYICVGNSLLFMLNRAELMFVLGHELGHAMSGHVRYHTLARALSSASTGILSKLTLGISDAVVQATVLPVLHAWQRCAEFTADRAGYLACQSREAALRTLIKLSGYPMNQYRHLRTRSILEQGRMYEKTLSESRVDRLWNALNVWNASHPLGVLRASELAEWIDRGLADEVVRADSRSLTTMVRQAAIDPNRFWLLSSAAERLEVWVRERFELPPSVAGPDVRRLVFAGEQPSWFTSLLQADVRIDSRHANRISYALELVYRDGADLKKLVIPLAHDRDWDELPSDLRQQWILGGGKELSLPIYRPARSRPSAGDSGDKEFRAGTGQTVGAR